MPLRIDAMLCTEEGRMGGHREGKGESKCE